MRYDTRWYSMLVDMNVIVSLFITYVPPCTCL